MDNDLLPLFPLEIVLLPEESLPLHIFEDRYKTMIGECLEAEATGKGQQEFGVVLLKEQTLRSVGCTARIVNVTRKYQDGRMDIVTEGRRRFKILSTDEQRPYLCGAVDYYEDEGPDTPSDEAAELAIERFREAMRKMRRATEMPAQYTQPSRYLSYRLAAILPLDLEFKQQLLIIRQESERLALVQHALDILWTQIEQAEKFHRKAGGNGHGR